MRLDLCSQIALNSVPEEFYNPKTAVERSEITRLEKLSTDIYTSCLLYTSPSPRD